MGLRHVARAVHSMAVHSMALSSLALLVGSTAVEAWAADVSEGANVRIATYRTADGEGLSLIHI